MSSKFQAPFQMSPYHTNSIVSEDDFKSTALSNHVKFNHDEVRRSAELTLIQRNALLKAANQITAPFAQNLSAKDRQRQVAIKTQWGLRHLQTMGTKNRPPHKLPPIDNEKRASKDGGIKSHH